MNAFAKRRQCARLRQKDVARFLQISPTTVSMWESGASYPRAELLPKVAKLYKCSIDDLISEKPPNRPSKPAPPPEEERRQQNIAGWG